MKRKHENIIIVDDESNKRLTKAQNKEKRQQENRQWKLQTKQFNNVNIISTEDENFHGNSSKSEANEGEETNESTLISFIDPNPNHSEYYKLQIPLLNAEWNEFQSTMSSSLPVSFRFSHTISNNFIFQEKIILQINKELKLIEDKYIEYEGTMILGKDICQSINWFHLNNNNNNNNNQFYVWNLLIDNKTFSTNYILKNFYNYILQQVNIGYIIRQELVSMIPSYVLNIQSTNIILDLCSAPGSKTEQSLYYLEQSNKTIETTGLMISNDIDIKRIHNLYLRYKENLNKNWLIINYNALKLYELFGYHSIDKVLCDVPCTGDATFRKCPHLWRLFK